MSRILRVVLVALAIVTVPVAVDQAQSAGGTTVTSSIDGAQGGVLKAGRFTLKVPKGAFEGRATITMSVASSTAKEVDLDITPASANQFAVPVTLSADVSDADLITRSSLAILYYNPSQGLWSLVPGSIVNLKLSTVSAPLRHFSRYGVGKPTEGRAGW